MAGYLTKMYWQDGEWWTLLLKDRQGRPAMSLAELMSLGAVQEAVEVTIADRAAAAEETSEGSAGEAQAHS
jgi:hypothetical protein